VWPGPLMLVAALPPWKFWLKFEPTFVTWNIKEKHFWLK
jgi:hypothetical protein